VPVVRVVGAFSLVASALTDPVFVGPAGNTNPDCGRDVTSPCLTVALGLQRLTCGIPQQSRCSLAPM
jgi:hypothetical protein